MVTPTAWPVLAHVLAYVVVETSAYATSTLPPVNAVSSGGDFIASQIIQEVAIKISNVSCVAEFYNLMVHYNKEYCSTTLLEALKKYSKSKSAKAAISSMKNYCEAQNGTHSLQKRGSPKYKKSNENDVGKEAKQIQQVLIKTEKMKIDCKPRKTIVEFPLSSGTVFHPRCTSVQRCLGCCKNKLRLCTPKKIRNVKRKVLEIHVIQTNNSSLLKTKVKILKVEQHSSCHCVCQCIASEDYTNLKTKLRNSKILCSVYSRIRCTCMWLPKLGFILYRQWMEAKRNVTASNCTSAQVYDENNCSCRCKNESQHKNCRSPKYWNSTSCQCECPTFGGCTTGQHRDHQTCKCTSLLPFENSPKRFKYNQHTHHGRN